MRLIAALMLLPAISGCGGCGSGVNASNISKYARRRSPDELDNAPTPTPAAAPRPADQAAQPTPIRSASPGAAPAAPAAATPAAVATEPMVAAPEPAVSAASSGSLRVAEETTASPTPASPIAPKIIVRNIKPDEPLSADERRERTVRGLQRVGRALAAYLEKTGELPSAIFDAQGKPLLSWRVNLLPYLGYSDLLDQFRRDEPWNSEYNRQLLEQIPPEYQSAITFGEKTTYQAVSGEGFLWLDQRGLPFESLSDGPERTLAVVEVQNDRAVPWTEPKDHHPIPIRSKEGLGSIREDGFFGVLANGDVRFVAQTIPEYDLWALLTVDADATRSTMQAVYNPFASNFASQKFEVSKEQAAADTAAAQLARALAAIHLPLPPESNRSRISPPEAAQQKKAKEQLRTLYQQDLEAAKRTEAWAALRKKFLEDADKVASDPGAYFVLLQAVRDIAVKGGELSDALAALDRLITRFILDENVERQKTIDETAAVVLKTKTNVKAFSTELERHLRNAVENCDYDFALKANQNLLDVARKANDRAQVTRLSNMRAELEGRQAEYKPVVEAVAALRADPKDAAANLAVARFLCFIENRWQEGLPLLAQGQNARLRVVAAMELDPSKEPQVMIELADQWWDLGQKSKVPVNRMQMLRATLWYSRAVKQNAQGVDRLRADKRLAEANALFGANTVAKIEGAFEKAGMTQPVAVTIDQSE